MDLKEFIGNFAEQFDETNPEEIQAGTVFHDLDEWSSLTTMSIITMVKERYGKAVTSREIRGCRDVEDLYNLVAAK